MEKWFDEMTKERMIDLVGVLAHLYHLDLATRPAATLSLSRCLEEVCSKYSLEGCSVISLQGKKSEVIARHGTGETSVEKLAGLFKAQVGNRAAARCHHDTVSDHHDAAASHHDEDAGRHDTGPSSFPPAPETRILSIDITYHAASSRVRADAIGGLKTGTVPFSSPAR